MTGEIGKPPKCKHVYPGGKKCEGETKFYSEWVCDSCGNAQEMHWRPGQRTLTHAALKEHIAALTEQLAEARAERDAALDELARLRAALAEEQAVVAALRERLSVVAADARWERRHDGPPPAPDRDMSYADMLRYAQGDFDHEAESIREQHRKEASDVR